MSSGPCTRHDVGHIPAALQRGCGNRRKSPLPRKPPLPDMVIRLETTSRPTRKHPTLCVEDKAPQTPIGTTPRLIDLDRNRRLGQCDESGRLAIQVAAVDTIELSEGATAVAISLFIYTARLPQLAAQIQPRSRTFKLDWLPNSLASSSLESAQSSVSLNGPLQVLRLPQWLTSATLLHSILPWSSGRLSVLIALASDMP